MCKIFYENLSSIGRIVFSKSCQPGRKTLFREKRDLLLFIKILCNNSEISKFSKFLNKIVFPIAFLYMSTRRICDF